MTMTRAEEPAAAGSGIEIRDVRHVYRGGTVALDGVSLSIGRGLFGLLGPNGAGKSTLMRIVCTLLRPTDGTVRVDGFDVVRQCSTVRARIGYLPQVFSAWRYMRVAEVLDTLGRLSGLRDAGERSRRVERLLDEVGLQEVALRKVKQLSGGMVRRLGVAQALLHDPPVLVVDEPTVGLDPQERLRFRKLMAGLGRERVIILSTHIVGDLGSSCRDLAILDQGRVVFRGDPQELVSRAQGRVFEMVAPVDREDFGPGVEIVSRTPEGVGVRVRAVVAGGAPPAEASLVASPTLEEAYLAFMAERGRTAAVLEEAAS